MDFYAIRTANGKKKGTMRVYPEFIVGKAKDIMVRGKSFYAVWDENAGLWSRDEYDVVRLVDADLEKALQQCRESDPGQEWHAEFLQNFDNGRWSTFKKFMAQIGDNSRELDARLTFKNTPPRRADYASKRLGYDLTPGDFSAWDDLISGGRGLR